MKKIIFILFAFCFVSVAGAQDNPFWNKSVMQSHEIMGIQKTMQERYRTDLEEALNKKFVAVSTTGYVVIQDIPLEKRAILRPVVAAENTQRKQLYTLISKKLGHPEWESQIAEAFGIEWVEKAQTRGWTITSSSS